ncbi:hypothetical protein [Streptomyces sp. NPDC090445]|uniref:hypothetical protein n=1 Tax=Streptomyces sp. NPDC090445 TaxID=3365963 RepID=UPI00380AE3EF
MGRHGRQHPGCRLGGAVLHAALAAARAGARTSLVSVVGRDLAALPDHQRHPSMDWSALDIGTGPSAAFTLTYGDDDTLTARHADYGASQSSSSTAASSANSPTAPPPRPQSHHLAAGAGLVDLVTTRKGALIHLTATPDLIRTRLLARDGEAPQLPEPAALVAAYDKVFRTIAVHTSVLTIHATPGGTQPHGRESP